MRKKLLILILTAAMLCSQAPVCVPAAQTAADVQTISGMVPFSFSSDLTQPCVQQVSNVAYTDILAKSLEIIGINEGKDTSVNPNDNGALSVGRMQWNASRALKILKMIVAANNRQAYEILGGQLYNEIVQTPLTKTAWKNRTVNNSEKGKIVALLRTDESRQQQDILSKSDVSEYINHGIRMGINNPAALVYFADVENQGGSGRSASCARHAFDVLKDWNQVTLNELHIGTICDVFSLGKNHYLSNASNRQKYIARRRKTYGFAASIGWTYCNSWDSVLPYGYPWMSPYTGTAWLQRALNVYQNAGLTVSDTYDDATRSAVRAFQQSNGLTVDGEAGMDTVNRLICLLYGGPAANTGTNGSNSTNGTNGSNGANGSSGSGNGTDKPSGSGNPAGKEKTVLAAPETSYSVNDTRGSFSLQVTSSHAETPLTYTSGSPEIAEADAAGTVTVKSAGKAQITVSQAESDHYAAVSLTISVTVYAADPDAYAVPSANLGDGRRMKQADIQWLQAALLKLGYYNGIVDGTWDRGTKKAVKAFQRAAGLAADGVAGPATRGSIQSMLEADKQLKEAEIRTPKDKFTKNDNSKPFSVGAKSSHSETPLTYSSSDDSVAAVDQNGKVTVKKAGTAQITVSQAQSAHYQAASKTVRVIVCSTDPAVYQVPAGLLGNGIAMKKKTVKWVQAALNTLGYSAGTVDGKWDAATTRAVKKFQKAAKLTADGLVGDGTRAALQNLLSVKGASLKAEVKAGSGKITVSWKEVPGALKYIVYRKAKGKSWKKLGSVSSGKKLKYTDRSAGKKKVYYYYVDAYRKTGSVEVRSSHQKSEAVQRAK